MSLDHERRELALSALPVAESVARSYSARFRHLDREDVLQNAYEGLVNAADRFDMVRVDDFERYARAIVRNHLTNCHFRQYSTPGEGPIRVAGLVAEVRSENPRMPDSEIAIAIDVPLTRVRANVVAVEAYKDIEYRGRVDALGAPFSDAVVSSEPDPIDAAASNERRRAVHDAFRSLGPLERRVVSYALYGRQSTLATELNVSKQRISQRYQAALSRLRPTLARIVA